MNIKGRMIGICKALIFIVILVFSCWVFGGFEYKLESINTTLAIGAIMIHFIDREINK